MLPRMHDDCWILLVFGLVTVVGCTQHPETDKDTGWTIGADTSPEQPEPGTDVDASESPNCEQAPEYCLATDVSVDSSGDPPPACPDDDLRFDSDAGVCVPDDQRDVQLVDAPSADVQPDTDPTTGVGQAFQGTTIRSGADVPIEYDHGVGLYWQSALSQFGEQALHRHLPNRPVLHLSAITSRGGDVDPKWSVPDADELPESRHFYRNYCEQVGEDTCRQEGIDDDRATFALIMVGIHEAPDDGEPSDCTYGEIRGKIPCDYGRLVAPSPSVMIVYAYRNFDPGNYPVFDKLGLPVGEHGELQQGYYVVFLPSHERDAGFQPLRTSQTRPGALPFDSSSMFPMLYP